MKPSAHAVLMHSPCSSSIHPQGWVPIETITTVLTNSSITDHVAFTPKGGCPLKRVVNVVPVRPYPVAFTPKGGCPLKLAKFEILIRRSPM